MAMCSQWDVQSHSWKKAMAFCSNSGLWLLKLGIWWKGKILNIYGNWFVTTDACFTDEVHIDRYRLFCKSGIKLDLAFGPLPMADREQRGLEDSIVSLSIFHIQLFQHEINFLGELLMESQLVFHDSNPNVSKYFDPHVVHSKSLKCLKMSNFFLSGDMTKNIPDLIFSSKAL